jgi:threonine synthase
MANAFYGLHNIDIAVLFPESEVTERQRKQMTTLDKNVQIIGLDAKFDDCQHLVKQAFNDSELDYLNLSSANSINIGRLIPQAVYYTYAYSRLCDINKGDEIIFSVPSGNFGDLMGGLLAFRMGVPVKKFVVATNKNDEVPVYFASGNYKTIVPSRNCISSAMNVGHPSNMARIVALYGGVMNEKGEIYSKPDLEQMKKDMFAVSVDDEVTRNTIRNIYKRHSIVLEPHGAVAWEGLRQYLLQDSSVDSPNQVCVSLETAHPAKFPEEINQLLDIDPELPLSLSGLENKPEKLDRMANDYQTFKNYLVAKYGK